MPSSAWAGCSRGSASSVANNRLGRMLLRRMAGLREGEVAKLTKAAVAVSADQDDGHALRDAQGAMRMAAQRGDGPGRCDARGAQRIVVPGLRAIEEQCGFLEG